MTGPAKGKEFSYTIATMRAGAADQVASEALKKVVEAVTAAMERNDPAKGKVTVDLTIQPMKDGDGELEVSVDVKIALPKVKIKTAIMYADEDFNLQKSNPKQLSMLNEGNDRGSRIPPHSEEALARVGRGDTVIDMTATRHERPAV